ncbi:MAG TPA: GNAT family N-acetyltransferase [Dehalococcoidia bacterium]|nr:GNAT family N-acetyltransferase [Dehalococcoidia bacterium]
MEGTLKPADRTYLAEKVAELWGWPVISVHRNYGPEDLEGLVYYDEWQHPQGLVTWHIEGDEAEMVTVNAFEQGRHVGGRLIDAAEAALRKRGVKRVTIVTTNDNTRAYAFYVRRGYRLIGVDLDAMKRVRAAKPGVPEYGIDHIPLQDMLELRKEL